MIEMVAAEQESVPVGRYGSHEGPDAIEEIIREANIVLQNEER